VAEIYFSPSEVMEHIFCPRFTYFIYCLDIPQHEELRYKVLRGRAVHRKRAKLNPEYLRKRLGCIKKEVLVYLVSPRLHLKGVVDEVLHLSDGTLAPLDYKFTEYREFTFRTHRYQSFIYALLIQDVYQKPVKRGFICYVRGGNKIKEVRYREADFWKLKEMLGEMIRIIEEGYFPKKTPFPIRCLDCCYKNICV